MGGGGSGGKEIEEERGDRMKGREEGETKRETQRGGSMVVEKQGEKARRTEGESGMARERGGCCAFLVCGCSFSFARVPVSLRLWTRMLIDSQLSCQ